MVAVLAQVRQRGRRYNQLVGQRGLVEFVAVHAEDRELLLVPARLDGHAVLVDVRALHVPPAVPAGRRLGLDRLRARGLAVVGPALRGRVVSRAVLVPIVHFPLHVLHVANHHVEKKGLLADLLPVRVVLGETVVGDRDARRALTAQVVEGGGEIAALSSGG